MPLFGRGKRTSSQFTTAIRAGKCLHLESDSDHIVCRKTFALAVFARVLRAFSPMLVPASLPQLPEFLPNMALFAVSLRVTKQGNN